MSDRDTRLMVDQYCNEIAHLENMVDRLESRVAKLSVKCDDLQDERDQFRDMYKQQLEENQALWKRMWEMVPALLGDPTCKEL